MAKRSQYKMSDFGRRRRTFSDSFKAEKVRELETGITAVTQLQREYDDSATSIYRWLNKFGFMKEKKERLISGKLK